MSAQLLIYAYADIRYSMFVVPYAFFALKSNPDAIVEVILEDESRFFEEYRESISSLRHVFGGRFIFRQSRIAAGSERVIPNTIRFVEEPRSAAKFLYIGDIDLLVLTDVASVHVGLMADFEQPFSNMLRLESINSGFPRLTGLHFCKYEDMYPLPDISDLDLLKLNDEHVLFEIMLRKGSMVDESFRSRPDCGIHMSLNRHPIGFSTGPYTRPYIANDAVRWNIFAYTEQFENIVQQEDFKKLYFSLSKEFRLLILVLEYAMCKDMRELHRIASSYMIDKRLFQVDQVVDHHELKSQRRAAIERKRHFEAEKINASLNMLWPCDIHYYFDRAWVAFANGNDDTAVASLLHMCDLPGGLAMLKEKRMLHGKRPRVVSCRDGELLLDKIENI